MTGTHVDNVDGQLGARPSGPGRVLLSVHRGSEVFEAQEAGLRLLSRRGATPEEDAALDAAAMATVAELARRGIDATVVSQRLNRRKIDLIPLSGGQIRRRRESPSFLRRLRPGCTTEVSKGSATPSRSRPRRPSRPGSWMRA